MAGQVTSSSARNILTHSSVDEDISSRYISIAQTLGQKSRNIIRKICLVLGLILNIS